MSYCAYDSVYIDYVVGKSAFAITDCSNKHSQEGRALSWDKKVPVNQGKAGIKNDNRRYFPARPNRWSYFRSVD